MARTTPARCSVRGSVCSAVASIRNSATGSMPASARCRLRPEPPSCSASGAPPPISASATRPPRWASAAACASNRQWAAGQRWRSSVPSKRSARSGASSSRPGSGSDSRCTRPCCRQAVAARSASSSVPTSASASSVRPAGGMAPPWRVGAKSARACASRGVTICSRSSVPPRRSITGWNSSRPGASGRSAGRGWPAPCAAWAMAPGRGS